MTEGEVGYNGNGSNLQQAESYLGTSVLLAAPNNIDSNCELPTIMEHHNTLHHHVQRVNHRGRSKKKGWGGGGGGEGGQGGFGLVGGGTGNLAN